MNKAIWGFLRKEFSQNLRDPRMLIFMIPLPAIQLITFGVIIRTETRNIRLAVSGTPDKVLEEVVNRADSSSWFVPAKVRGVDPYQWVKSGEAEAVLISPPEGLEKSMAEKNGRLQVLIDASNGARARNIEAYLSSIVAEVSHVPPPLFKFSVKTLYNPELKTPYFMVPSIIGMILCLVAVPLSSMSFARETDFGTMEMLLMAPVKKREIILGKTIPFVVITMVIFLLCVAGGVFGFGVPERGPLWMLLLGGLVFIATMVEVGFWVFTLAPTQQGTMVIGFIILFLQMQLSGIGFPLDNIPKVIAWISYLNPLRYFITMLINIMLKGGNPHVFWENLSKIGLIGLSVTAMAVRRLSRTLN